MKRLIAIPVIVLFCLGLSGCNALTDVSQYFAGLEDFVRGNPKSTVGIGDDGDGGDGGGGGGGGAAFGTLTVVCFKRPLLDIRVDGDEAASGKPVHENLDPPNIKSGINFAEIFLNNGTYTLSFDTGQPPSGDDPGDLDTFGYGPVTIDGADLTLMVIVNEKPDEENPIRDVRVVELPGSGVAD